MLRYLLHLYDVAHSSNPVQHIFPSVKFSDQSHARDKLNETVTSDEKSKESSLHDSIASDAIENSASSQRYFIFFILVSIFDEK